MLRLASVMLALAARAEPTEQKPAKVWRGATVEDLHRQYGVIFGAHGNRNAASHLWSTWVLDRASQMSASTFVELMGGFCAVSGSIVRPSEYNRYRVTLPTADGAGFARGFMHYCCWPCVCDTQDFIHADSKTIETTDGPRRHVFAVLGDPCAHEEQLDAPFVQPFGFRTTSLRREAPAVRCEGGRLAGATFSDGGHVIVALLFDANVTSTADARAAARARSPATPTPGRLSRDGAGRSFHDELEYAAMCEARAASGYNSGMGEIFRKVAQIAPIRGGARRRLAGEAACPSAEPSSGCGDGAGAGASASASAGGDAASARGDVASARHDAAS